MSSGSDFLSSLGHVKPEFKGFMMYASSDAVKGKFGPGAAVTHEYTQGTALGKPSRLKQSAPGMSKEVLQHYYKLLVLDKSPNTFWQARNYATFEDILNRAGNSKDVQKFKSKLLAPILAKQAASLISYKPKADSEIASMAANELDLLLGTKKIVIQNRRAVTVSTGRDPFGESLGVPAGISPEIDEARQLLLRGAMSHFTNQQMPKVTPLTGLTGI